MNGPVRALALALGALMLLSPLIVLAPGSVSGAEVDLKDAYWEFKDGNTWPWGTVVLSEDGNLLAALNTTSSGLAVYSIAEKEMLWNTTGKAGGSAKQPLAISGNGKVLAYADASGWVRMFNATTGTVITSYQLSDPYLNEMVITYDGSKLVIGMVDETFLLSAQGVSKKYDLVSGDYHHVAMSRDGEVIAMCSFNTYVIFDGALQPMDSQILPNKFTDVKMSDDGVWLAFSGYDGKLVIERYTSGGTNWWYPDFGDGEVHIALSGDGSTLFGASDSYLFMYDMSMNGVIWQMPISSFYGTIWISHDGSLARTLDGFALRLQSYGRASNLVIDKTQCGNECWTMSNTPDGSSVALLSADGVTVYRPELTVAVQNPSLQACSGQNATLIVKVDGAMSAPTFNVTLSGNEVAVTSRSLGEGEYAIDLTAPSSDDTVNFNGKVTASCVGQVSADATFSLQDLGTNDPQNAGARTDQLNDQVATLNLMVIITLVLVVVLGITVIVLVLRRKA
jgi:WD40 repeat protein